MGRSVCWRDTRPRPAGVHSSLGVNPHDCGLRADGVCWRHVLPHLRKVGSCARGRRRFREPSRGAGAAAAAERGAERPSPGRVPTALCGPRRDFSATCSVSLRTEGAESYRSHIWDSGQAAGGVGGERVLQAGRRYPGHPAGRPRSQRGRRQNPGEFPGPHGAEEDQERRARPEGPGVRGTRRRGGRPGERGRRPQRRLGQFLRTDGCRVPVAATRLPCRVREPLPASFRSPRAPGLPFPGTLRRSRSVPVSCGPARPSPLEPPTSLSSLSQPPASMQPGRRCPGAFGVARPARSHRVLARSTQLERLPGLLLRPGGAQNFGSGTGRERKKAFRGPGAPGSGSDGKGRSYPTLACRRPSTLCSSPARADPQRLGAPEGEASAARPVLRLRPRPGPRAAAGRLSVSVLHVTVLGWNVNNKEECPSERVQGRATARPFSGGRGEAPLTS